MFKITFNIMREERNQPREVKKISRKMLKRRQNEVKRNIFLFDEVKNITGRIPETTRSENQFKRHPTTHQTKKAFTIL